jgi:LemA protein
MSDWLSTRTLLVALGALLAFWIVGAHNRLVRLRSEAAAAWAPLAEQLRRRHALAGELADLLATPGLDAEGAAATGVPINARVPPDLVVATEAVLAAAAQARAATDHAQARATDAGVIQSLALAEQVLVRSLGALRRVQLDHPRWPSIAAAEQVEALAQALQQTEAQIDFAGRHHAAAVTVLNGAVHEWPTRVVAALFGIRRAAALPLLGATEAPTPR